MKLLRFEGAGKPRLGALRGEAIVALDAIDTGYPTMLSIVAGGTEALRRVAEVVGRTESTLLVRDIRLLAPTSDRVSTSPSA